MNTTRNIAKNIGMLGISSVITSILGFFLLIYIARYLGEIEFGKYSFAISFTTLLITFFSFGINNLIIREIARNKERTNEYLTNVLLIKIPLCILAFIFTIIVINILNYPPDTVYAVYLFGIYMILTSFGTTFRSIFQAYEKMEYDAILTIIEKLLLVILVLFVVFSGHGLIELAYIYIFTGIMSVMLSATIVFIKISKPRLRINLSLWKSLLIESIPFGLNALFAILFFKIDIVMISILKNDAMVGIYSAAYNPLLALGIIPSVFIAAIYPVMSRLFISSPDSLDVITERSSKYMAIIGFPVAIGCFVLADRFIELFYVDQFSASIAAFQILAFFIPLRWISSITGTFLTSTNRQGFRTLGVGLGALINIILNAVMIPSMGYIGACVATVLSEIFLYFIFIYFINKNYKKLTLNRHFIKPSVASLMMGGFILYFSYINLLLLVALAFVFYFMMLLLMKTFSEVDKKILTQVIKQG